jgi:4-nitrophenyl phosphatase
VSKPSINLDAYQAVLLDLDGTVYHEEHALPGAVELIKRLQRDGRPYACLTNSTSSPARLTARLRRMGVDVDPAHIYTAAAATCDYVLQRFGDPAAAAVMENAPASTTPPLHHSTTPSLPKAPRVFNLSTEGVHDMLDGRVHWVQSESEPCDAIICGVPLNVFATEERQRTAMILLRQGAALVSICADRVYPSPRGLEFGVGAFAAMFAYAANVTPVFCGKPEALFFQELCRRLGVRPEQCVLVGDNLESDIAGAAGVGMHTILTLSGVATRADVERLDPARRPGRIIEDLRELLP